MDERTLMQRLAAPFEAHEVKWRVQQEGESNGRPWVRVLAYIDNAAVMSRLDAVVGAGGWQNRFEQFEGGVICGLQIKLGDQWVTKWDGAAATQTEPFKGALSGAMKRAAVMWGIGRYLHGMGESFAEIITANDQRYRSAKRIKGKDYRWLPPTLDAKYLPNAVSGVPQVQVAQTNDEALRPLPTERPREKAPAKPLSDAIEREMGSAGMAVLSAGSVKLPGSKSNLLGFGGSPIAAVPREHLPEIRAKLATLDSVKYTEVITAINEYLEATRPL